MEEITVENLYERVSKLGHRHQYRRCKTMARFRCDSCDSVFERSLKMIDRKRLDNSYFHCCSNCDQKRFAQKKSAESRKIWDLPAGLDWPIGKY